MAISLRTMTVLRALLVRAIQLIDAETKLQEGGVIGCSHSNSVELTTMGKGPRRFMCMECRARYTDEVEDERVETFRGSGLRTVGVGAEEGNKS